MSRLEVNEARVFASRRGMEWWGWFRMSRERAGGVEIVAASIGGDRVRFDFDNAAAFIKVATDNGVPQQAIKVIRFGGVA